MNSNTLELRSKLYRVTFTRVKNMVSDALWHHINESLYNKVVRLKVGYYTRHKIKDVLFESFDNSMYESVAIKTLGYEFCRNAN